MKKRQRNTFFECKEFRIEQQGAAMKVTTDACVLGAWAPVEAARHVLDIGTGSGLLSLFIAQRAPQAIIDAVEIDPQSAAQAERNFAASPFSDRLNIHCTDILHFTSPKRYDLLLSNPPFFDGSTPNACTRLSQARHTLSLPLAAMLDAIARLLSPTGRAFLLLDTAQAERAVEQLSTHRLYMRYQLDLSSQPGDRPHRTILGLSPQAGETVTKELMLYRAHPIHTREAGQLFYPFYTRLRCEDPTYEIL